MFEEEKQRLILEQLQNYRVIAATSKTRTIESIIEYLQIDGEQIEGVDAELVNHDSIRVPEISSPDPRQVALSKIRVLLEFLFDHPTGDLTEVAPYIEALATANNEEVDIHYPGNPLAVIIKNRLTVLAVEKEIIETVLEDLIEKAIFLSSDVVCHYDGMESHKPSRDAATFSDSELKVRIIDRYKNSSQVTWYVSFACWAHGYFVTTPTIAITADLPRLSDEDFEKYIDFNTNPGLRLIELLTEKNAQITASINGEPGMSIPAEVAIKMIKDKAPPNKEVLLALLGTALSQPFAEEFDMNITDFQVEVPIHALFAA